jgi:hypothetical protein
MNAVLAALFTSLSADTGPGGVNTLSSGGIFDSVAPQGATRPFTIIHKQAPAPTLWTFSQKAADEALYLVKAYAADTAVSGGRKVAGAIIERAEALLNDAALPVSGHTLLACRKAADVPDSCEWDGDERVFGVGSLFRIAVQ